MSRAQKGETNAMYRHGHRTKTRTKTYVAWCSMKARCADPKNISYQYYGAKGVRVCSRWEKFENFLEDMGEAPVGTSLDRRDSRKNYSKSNCRWASLSQQNSNKSNQRLVAFRGKTQNLAHWARELGIRHGTLHERLAAGWTVRAAFTRKVAKR